MLEGHILKADDYWTLVVPREPNVNCTSVPPLSSHILGRDDCPAGYVAERAEHASELLYVILSAPSELSK